MAGFMMIDFIARSHPEDSELGGLDGPIERCRQAESKHQA
jgi:hypothetical protein